MTDYEFFYDVCEYGNEHWKGNFTPKEMACSAYDYLLEMELSKAKGKATSVIADLLELLNEDNTEEAEYFALMIKGDLGWEK